MLTTSYDVRAVLESKIKLADRLLADVNAKIEALGPHLDNSYSGQELKTAAFDLRAIKASTARALESLPPAKPLDALAERRRRSNDSLLEIQVKSTLAFVAKLEREGDWRQAKLHLLSILDLRDQIEREAA